MRPTAFLRLGTGFDNYYEIEVPLTITPTGTSDPNIIWPAENQINVPFTELYRVKLTRNEADVSLIYHLVDLIINIR